MYLETIVTFVTLIGDQSVMKLNVDESNTVDGKLRQH